MILYPSNNNGEDAKIDDRCAQCAALPLRFFLEGAAREC